MSDEGGTSFEIDLPVKGTAEVEAAASALDKTSKAMEAATSALKAGEASYRKTESAADSAAKALERVGMSADEQRTKLAQATKAGDEKAIQRAANALEILEQRQAKAAARATELKTALANEAAALDKMKAEATKATEAQGKLGESSEGEGFKFEGLERGLGKFGGPLADLGRSVAGVGSGFGKLSKSLGSTGAAAAIGAVGIVALVAAFVALSAAVVESIAKVAVWAVGMADANRSAALLSQGIARSVQGGQLLDDKIDSLNRKLPLTREELSGMASNLANAGLRGQALTDSLQRSAIAAAKLKFGPNFADQMLSLDEQSKVFKANLADVFGGLKIDGLLRGLQTLVSLFDSSTASGKAIKVVFESLFQPVVDGATNAIPKVERFFLTLEIWALKALIWLKPHGSLFVKLGEAMLIVAGIVTGVLVTAVALLAVPFVAVMAAITGVVFALMNLGSIGRAMVDGLVKGIEAGGSAVLDALKGVATKAVDGVKKALGIASPAKLLADEVGENMGLGVAVGINRTEGKVGDALENVTAPTGKTGQPTPAPASTGTSSGSGANFAGAVFNLYGVEGAQDAEARIGALLTRLIEGDVAQLGAAVPG